MKIKIRADELIVGNLTEKDRGAIVTPEVGWRWIINELQLFSTRKAYQHKHAAVSRMSFVLCIKDDEHDIRLICEYPSKLDNIIQIDLLPYDRMAVSKYARLGSPHKAKAIEKPTPELLSLAAETLRKPSL